MNVNFKILKNCFVAVTKKNSIKNSEISTNSIDFSKRIQKLENRVKDLEREKSRLAKNNQEMKIKIESINLYPYVFNTFNNISNAYVL